MENTDKGEIMKFIEQMPIADSKHIRKFMYDNEPLFGYEKTSYDPVRRKPYSECRVWGRIFSPFLLITESPKLTNFTI